MEGCNRRYRIAFMGSSKVGKTAIIKRYLEGIFVSRYYPTLEDLYQATMKRKDGGANILLDILDTCGDGQFPAMRTLAIRRSDAFVLVFAVGENERVTTFAEVEELRQTINELRGKSAPIVIVGNKNDQMLCDAGMATLEAIALMDWGNAFLTCSAKENINISEILEEVVRQIERNITSCFE